MRISDSILSANYLASLNSNKEQVEQIQEHIASGSKINKPSDSPSGISRVLRLQEQLQAGDTYTKNIEDSQSFIQTTASTLEGMQNEIQDSLVLFTDASNPVNVSNYPSYAKQLDMTISSLLDLANSQFGGKYLFSGTDFSGKPYSLNGSRVEQNVPLTDGKQVVRISKYIDQTVNIPGNDLFGAVPKPGDPVGTNTDIFNTLLRIKGDLEGGQRPSDSDVALVKTFQENLAGQLTTAGNIINRLDSTHELLDNQQLELKGLLSKEKDVDVAASVMDLQNRQYYLELSYKMSSMILPKSLLDYM
ncbi:MAG TPA: flagellin [Ignavibacteriales bacterium]|nr:flagellin [Ignavibacteriales bacterium]